MTETIESPVTTEGDVMDEVIHICCCRKYAEQAICGVDLTGHSVVTTSDANCPMCADETRDAIKAALMHLHPGRFHCPLDGALCPEDKK